MYVLTLTVGTLVRVDTNVIITCMHVFSSRWVGRGEHL